MALGGTVTRPSTGARVVWQAAYPVVDDFEEARRRGIPCLGVIGNAAHLAASGQHTPWSGNGWAYGWVHAIDLAISAGQWMKILAELRTGRWNAVVRFVNYGGKQYHQRDGFRSSRDNPDHHLHISYAPGTHKRAGAGLIRAALMAGLESDELSAADVNKIVYGVDEGEAPGEWQTKGAAPSLQHIWQVLANMQGALAVVVEDVAKLKAGGVDVTALAAAVAKAVPAPTVDVAAIVKAVNDDHAKRMGS